MPVSVIELDEEVSETIGALILAKPLTSAMVAEEAIDKELFAVAAAPSVMPVPAAVFAFNAML